MLFSQIAMRKSTVVLIILLGTSIIFNILFVVSDVLFEIKAKAIIKKDFTVSEVLKNKKDFRAQLVSTLKANVVSGRRIEFPSTNMFVTERLTSTITPPQEISAIILE